MTEATAVSLAAHGGRLGPTFAHRTPLRIGAVGLVVRDLDRLARFYGDLLGLAVLAAEPHAVTLGVGDLPLVALTGDAAARPAARPSAGLYHTAFLMPTRDDLGRWLRETAAKGIRFAGFADHHVSEAIYLDDPEGNGIEVYADRPRDSWRFDGDMIRMGTEPLDVQALVAAAGPVPYGDAPEGLRIGHMHLKVGQVAQAERFYGDVIGLDRLLTIPRAAFLSSGGYHHHLGLNSWQSAGAGPRRPGETGLHWFSLHGAPETVAAIVGRAVAAGAPCAGPEDAALLADPWGNDIRLVAD